MNKTQTIKKYLEEGGRITDMTAARFFNNYRLSGTIHILRHKYDMDIRDKWLENKNTGTRFKEYYLHKEK